MVKQVFLFIILFSFSITSFILRIEAQGCQLSGTLIGTAAPEGQCNSNNCCKEGVFYDMYGCSPQPNSSGYRQAILTLNSFQEGGVGGDASSCDVSFHSDDEMIVALSTGWFDNKTMCGKFITINGNGSSVSAKVVDECDSMRGCDKEHAYQPPCRPNIVDASKAVWSALLNISYDQLRDEELDDLEISWTDDA